MTDPPSSSPVTRSAALAGAFSIIVAVSGAVAAGTAKGCYDIRLAERKHYSDLVLLALRSDSAEQRQKTLRFMLDAGLIQDERIRRGLDDLLARSRTDSSAIPRIGEIPPPSIPNARVYLLAGSAAKSQTFGGLRAELARAGFTVVGERLLRSDPGRPDEAEVRYFHAVDSAQAHAMAATLRQRPPYEQIKALGYFDARVRPGYIEIWLGR